jgi:hypothetical protein
LLLAGACSAGTTTSVHTLPTKPADREVQLDRVKLRAKLAERRAVTFERFLAYRNARVYPINHVPGSGAQHIWLDDNGNLCAAATLLSKDWGRDAAIAVGAKNRGIRLADTKTGALADWMLATGMTRAELVAIQAPSIGVDDGSWRNPGEPVIAMTPNERLFQMYLDLERQLRDLWDENLDLATDALLARPELARQLLSA